jgi:hypothetical protein
MTADLSEAPHSGVYVILCFEHMRTVKIGYGNVAELILAARQDQQIFALAQSGTLEVTWAAARPEQMIGMVRDLSDQLKPLIKINVPYDAPSIPTNLPG